MINKIKKNKHSKLLICIIMLVIYFIWLTIMQLPSIFASNGNKTFLFIYNLIVYLLFLSLFISFYDKEIIKDLKRLLKNKNTIFKILGYTLGILIIIIICNALISTAFHNNSTNNVNIVNSLNDNIILSLINILLFAPIVEELIFRRSLYDIINNKYLYIIVSGILFGIYFLMFSSLNIAEIFLYFQYFASGIYYAFVYNKEKNIVLNIIIRIIYNLIFLLVTLL